MYNQIRGTQTMALAMNDYGRPVIKEFSQPWKSRECASSSHSALHGKQQTWPKGMSVWRSIYFLLSSSAIQVQMEILRSSCGLETITPTYRQTAQMILRISACIIQLRLNNSWALTHVSTWARLCDCLFVWIIDCQLCAFNDECKFKQFSERKEDYYQFLT